MMDRNRTFHEVEWDTVLALLVWGVAGGYKQLALRLNAARVAR